MRSQSELRDRVKAAGISANTERDLGSLNLKEKGYGRKELLCHISQQSVQNHLLAFLRVTSYFTGRTREAWVSWKCFVLMGVGGRICGGVHV